VYAKTYDLKTMAAREIEQQVRPAPANRTSPVCQPSALEVSAHGGGRAIAAGARRGARTAGGAAAARGGAQALAGPPRRSANLQIAEV
jgi:hypothetical protein